MNSNTRLSQHKLAPIQTRIAATAIDGLILLAIISNLWFSLGYSLWDSVTMSAPVLLVLFLLALLYLYEVIFLVLFSRTPGKALFSLRVISANGEALSWKQATIRYFVDQLLPNNIGLLDELRALRDTRTRQTFHDYMAKTVVVQDRNLNIPRKLLLWITFLLVIPIQLLLIAAWVAAGEYLAAIAR